MPSSLLPDGSADVTVGVIHRATTGPVVRRVWVVSGVRMATLEEHGPPHAGLR